MLTADSDLNVIPNALAAVGALLMWGTAFGMRFLSRWDLTEAGKNYLYVNISFAALLTMNTVHLFVKDYPGITIVRTLVYGGLAVAAYRIGRTVWKGIFAGKPAEEWYSIVVHPKKEKSDA